jgi:hypothetical protein
VSKLIDYDVQISYKIHEKCQSLSQETYLEKFIDVLSKLPIGKLSPQLDQFMISSLIRKFEKSQGNEVNIRESPFLRLSTPPIENALFFIDHVHFYGSNKSKKKIELDNHFSKINDLVSNIISLIVANEIISNKLEVLFELTFEFENINFNKIEQFVKVELIDDKIEDYIIKFKYKFNENINLVMKTNWNKLNQNGTSLLTNIIYEQKVDSINNLDLVSLKDDLIKVRDNIGGRLE